MFWFYLVLGIVLIATLYIGASEIAYRNGFERGRQVNIERETKQLELLVRALMDMEGNQTSRASRVVSDIRKYLEAEEKFSWIKTIRRRTRNEAAEEATFQ